MVAFAIAVGLCLNPGAKQWLRRPGEDGDLSPSTSLVDCDEGVVDLLIKSDISGDNRNRLEVGIGVEQTNQQGETVIRSRIRIDNQFSLHTTPPKAGLPAGPQP
jgi:hypothetical protein